MVSSYLTLLYIFVNIGNINAAPLASNEKTKKLVCASPQYLKLGFRGVISCTITEVPNALSWYDSMNYVDENPVIFVSEAIKDGDGYQSGEYDVTQNGSLIISNVLLSNEHHYVISALFDGSTKPVISIIRVVVTIPSLPFVEGCKQQQNCTLVVETEGHLECEVSGIRPEVTLQWNTLFEEDAPLISFTNNQITVRETDGTFDVSLESTYLVTSNTLTKLTLQCQVLGSQSMSDLTKTVDLIFVQEYSPSSTEKVNKAATVEASSNKRWWILIVLVILLLCCMNPCKKLATRLRRYRGQRGSISERPQTDKGSKPETRELLNVRAADNPGGEGLSTEMPQEEGNSEMQLKEQKNTFIKMVDGSAELFLHGIQVVLDESGKTIEDVKGKLPMRARVYPHNLMMGTIQENDVVLYVEGTTKSFSFPKLKQRHVFKYECKPGEVINYVLVKDGRKDGTGGNAHLIKGRPGEKAIEIKVTSKFLRGMDFSFCVLGSKTSDKRDPNSPSGQ